MVMSESRKSLDRTAIVAVLAASLMSAQTLCADSGDVLYWMVDDTATVADNGTGETKSITAYYDAAAEAGQTLAARVRVTGGDITGDTFLDLFDEEGERFSGEYGVDFSDGAISGYWGAGVPTGNQSPSGSYSAGSPEFAFTIERGNVEYNELADTFSWTTVAASATQTYSELATYIHETWGMSVDSLHVWTPAQFTAAPEPTSGMLGLLGLAFLALRRRMEDSAKC